MIFGRCAGDELIEDFRPHIVFSLELMKLLGQSRQRPVSGEAAAHHPLEKIFLRPFLRFARCPYAHNHVLRYGCWATSAASVPRLMTGNAPAYFTKAFLNEFVTSRPTDRRSLVKARNVSVASGKGVSRFGRDNALNESLNLS
jgi:hypothetical protein